MREWLHGLTRPEDQLLWAWVVIALGYGVVGVWLGRRSRSRSVATKSMGGALPAAPADQPSRGRSRAATGD